MRPDLGAINAIAYRSGSGERGERVSDQGEGGEDDEEVDRVAHGVCPFRSVVSALCVRRAVSMPLIYHIRYGVQVFDRFFLPLAVTFF